MWRLLGLVLLLHAGVTCALSPTGIIVTSIFGSFGVIAVILIGALLFKYTFENSEATSKENDSALTEVVTDGRTPYTIALKTLNSDEASLATVSSLSEEVANFNLQEGNFSNNQQVSKQHESSYGQDPEIADNYSKNETLVFEDDETRKPDGSGYDDLVRRSQTEDELQNDMADKQEKQTSRSSPPVLHPQEKEMMETPRKPNETPSDAETYLDNVADPDQDHAEGKQPEDEETEFKYNNAQAIETQQQPDSVVIANPHYDDAEPNDREKEANTTKSPIYQWQELENADTKFAKNKIKQEDFNDKEDALPNGFTTNSHVQKENIPAEQELTKPRNLSSKAESQTPDAFSEYDNTREKEQDEEMIVVTEVEVQTDKHDLLMSEYLQTSSDPTNKGGTHLESDSSHSEQNFDNEATQEGARCGEEGSVKDVTVEEPTALQVSDRSLHPDFGTDVVKSAKKRDEIVFTSGWGRVVRLLDLFKTGLVSEDTITKLEHGQVDEQKVASDLGQYLKGEEPIGGLLMDNGDVMSLFEASQKGIVRRGTAVSLLEAQAATGSIINPHSGDKMRVSEATQCNLIDKQFESILIRAERAVLGYRSQLSDRPLSLFEAMQRGLVAESRGIRLLEAQMATGGIIDPHANHRLSVDVAFERGLFDRRLHVLLTSPDKKGFYDPNTNENLTYLELMQRCTIATDTGLRLLPFRQGKSRKR